MSVCGGCGHEVGGAKFCPECGTPVAQACPGCGAPAGAGRFCAECGAPLGESLPVAERRITTVLFGASPMNFSMVPP